MSRSRHHGCGRACGVCRPWKRFPSNRASARPLAVQRAVADVREQLHEVGLDRYEQEWFDLAGDADPDDFGKLYDPEVAARIVDAEEDLG